MIPDEHAGALVRITAGRGEGQERVVRSNTATTLQVARPWDIVPDGSSRFSIADYGWQAGGTGSEGTASVALPGRFGRTVQLLVRASSAGGRESASELGIVTRWQLGSALGTDYRGGLLVGGISWPNPVNLRTIDTGMLTVWGWDERLSPTPHRLTGALSASSDVVSVAGPATWSVGDVLQISGEVMRVTAVTPGGLQVARAQFRTAAAQHPVQAAVFRLTASQRNFPFPQGFFGSTAGANWQERIDLAETRVACASLVLVNEYGPSAAGEVNLTLLEDYGLRTLAGGQLLLQVPGYLAISDNAVPPVKTDRLRVVHDVYAEVNEAPQGNPVRVLLLVDGAAYGELVIEPGQTVSDSISGWNRPALRDGAAIGLRVLGVGSPAAGSPGRDLTVAIRY
jgi:hypothetical protein